MMGRQSGCQNRLFYSFNLEDLVPTAHPLRVPVHAGPPFRRMPGHRSSPCQASVPAHAGPPFW